jgi:hypothetical protein
VSRGRRRKRESVRAPSKGMGRAHCLTQETYTPLYISRGDYKRVQNQREYSVQKKGKRGKASAWM